MQVDLVPVAALAIQQPDQHLGIDAQLIDGRGLAAADGGQAAGAQVVAPALEHGGLEVQAERLPEQGDVLGQQLLLQVDRVRGDDHALAVLQRPVYRRDEVGHGLARACAGLDEQVLAVVEGLGHGAQHLPLFRAVLVAGQALRQQAIFLQQAGQSLGVQADGLLVGRQGSPVIARCPEEVEERRG